MFYLTDPVPSWRAVVLDVEDLDRLRRGFALGEPHETALVCYTPDPDWLEDRMKAGAFADPDGLLRLVAESLTRPTRATTNPRPPGGHERGTVAAPAADRPTDGPTNGRAAELLDRLDRRARQKIAEDRAADGDPPAAGRPPRLRDAMEVQRAHDVLWAVVMGETPLALERSDHLCAQMSLHVLCWALGHGGGDVFAQALASLERDITAAGGEMREYPRGDAK